MNDLLTFYSRHDLKVSDKWSIYLYEYDRLLSSYRSRRISFLEIGVQNGGSLEIWAKYFDQAECIIGCDINEKCGDLKFEDPRISVEVGDACQPETKAKILKHAQEFDVIIEDGSHTSEDIIKTFAIYFENLKNGGVFIFEDLHCSYWKEWGGGLYDPHSSITFFKNLIDVINHEHWAVEKSRNQFLSSLQEKYGISFNCLESIHSIEFFNSVCVVTKKVPQENVLGTRCIAGLQEHVVFGHHSVQKYISPPDQSENIWSNLEKSPAENWMEINKCLNEAHHSLNECQVELELLLNSMSWKLTRPLRMMSRLVNRIRQMVFKSFFQ